VSYNNREHEEGIVALLGENTKLGKKQACRALAQAGGKTTAVFAENSWPGGSTHLRKRGSDA